MHLALQIDEILLNIFSHCNPPVAKGVDRRDSSPTASDLVALARTCHLFKEPALDVLWSELADLTPLARCLPEVCYPKFPGCKGWYIFHRPLKQEEWDTLRSYTRRVRFIQEFGSAFDPECVRTFLNPLTPESLFPNVCYLRCSFTIEVTPLLRQPLPSLISLDYSFVFEANSALFRDSLESFPGVSPNIRQLSIRVDEPLDDLDQSVFFYWPIASQTVSDYICRWPDPRIVSCSQITLNVDAVKHLSCTDLIQLSFLLDETLPDQITCADGLRFNRLQKLELYTTSMIPVSKFLACIQLPAITDFTGIFKHHPSKQVLASFLAALQTSATGSSIVSLGLLDHIPVDYGFRPDNALVCGDLRPTMAFRNLRRLELDLRWKVNLTDDDLLELASAWPHLEHLLINRHTGWRRASGGITPNGIIRLLQTCRSLSRLALAIDSRGSVEALRSPPSVHPHVVLSRSLFIDVVDSIIGRASVLDMTAFFGHLMSFARLSLMAWRSSGFQWTRDVIGYSRRWYDAFRQAEKVFQERRVNLC